MDQQAKNSGNNFREVITVTFITVLFTPLVSIVGTFIFKVFGVNSTVTDAQALLFLGAIAFLRAFYFYFTTPWDVEARRKIKYLGYKQEELLENVEIYNKQLESTVANEVFLKAIIKSYMDFDPSVRGGIALDLPLIAQIEKEREDLFIVHYVDNCTNKKVLYLKRSDELNEDHKSQL